MNYHIKTKQKKNPSVFRAFIVVGICFLVFGVIYVTKTGFFFGIFGHADATVAYTEQSTQSLFGSLIGHIKSNQSLQDENTNLTYSLSQLSAVVSERDMLLRENETLKGVISEAPGSELARVVSSPSQSFYDIIVVTLKPESQVVVGDFVWTQGNVLLGTVISRTGNLARVELFSSIGKEITGRLEKDGTELILSGRGGGNFFIAAPRALPISENDLISLPTLRSNIIARVRTTEEGRVDSFKSVYLTSPVNVFSLSWVRISHAEIQ